MPQAKIKYTSQSDDVSARKIIIVVLYHTITSKMKDQHRKFAAAIITATALSVAVTITAVNGKGQKKTRAQIKRDRRSVELKSWANPFLPCILDGV